MGLYNSYEQRDDVGAAAVIRDRSVFTRDDERRELIRKLIVINVYMGEESQLPKEIQLMILQCSIDIFHYDIIINALGCGWQYINKQKQGSYTPFLAPPDHFYCAGWPSTWRMHSYKDDVLLIPDFMFNVEIRRTGTVNHTISPYLKRRFHADLFKIDRLKIERG